LELLLTGTVARFDRSAVWRDGWRNVHDGDQSFVEARFAIDGDRGETVVRRVWVGERVGEAETWVQRPGGPRTGLEALSWGPALSFYRPFLSHRELESLLDNPSALHDDLAKVLGLGELDAAIKRLAEQRKPLDTLAKDARTRRPALASALAAADDARARRCLELLDRPQPDIAGLEGIARGSEARTDAASPLEPLRMLEALPRLDDDALQGFLTELDTVATRWSSAHRLDAHRAHALSELLSRALRYHEQYGEQDCPVCSTPNALDEGWRQRARAGAAELEEVAGELRAVTEEASVLIREIEDAVRMPTIPQDVEGIETGTLREAWRLLAAVPTGNDAGALRRLADHLRAGWPEVETLRQAVADAAAEHLRYRDARWLPIADDVLAWCRLYREGQAAAAEARKLKGAEDWLNDALDAIRNERLAPIADQAQTLWQELRQQSNVDLREIRLSGARTRRHVDFEVAIDGVDGQALGVMSQGELNALALSVFLPRASMPESPFRFVVVDDPVQAMDPAKVEGLARVFGRLGESRQVVVFTHDARLADAVTRLEIPATTIEIDRQPQSQVNVTEIGDPSQRSLDDAAHLNDDRNVPDEIKRRVVPGLCRQAMEAAFLDRWRRRGVASGLSHESIDDAAASATKLYAKASLALFGQADRASEVLGTLSSRYGTRSVDAFKVANAGSHGGASISELNALVVDARQLCGRLRDER
jgi:ABC-type lipoprotein export system ATPase subunit